MTVDCLRVLIDTNIALDLLLTREPHLVDALHIFSLAEQGKLELLLSTDSLSTIFYIVEKHKDAKVAREAISKLLDFVTLTALDESAVLKGMALDFTDIEDAFICSVAMKSGVSAIITRDGKDFVNSPIPVRSPREFLAAFEAI